MNNEMETVISILKTTRERILDLLNNYDSETLNRIPAGYKNNLIWNAGHCLATQNLLTYGLSQVPFYTDSSIIDLFRKGTSPNGNNDSLIIDQVKTDLLKSPEHLLQAFNNNEFNSFTAYKTSYGFNLNSIKEAILFNSTHEALHLGYMMAMRKSL